MKTVKGEEKVIDMKETLKRVMTRAWEIKREDSRNIWGLCLKMAWAEIKSADKEVVFYGIKDWFAEKNFTQSERYIIKLAIAGGDLHVIDQTEKALKFTAESDYGDFTFWCPKSCLMTKEDIENKTRALKKGLAYNLQLLEIAKENGLKVRKGMKTLTLIKKLKEAGIDVPEKAA